MISTENNPVNELAIHISQLIEIALKEKENWTKKVSFLFQQLEQVKYLQNYLSAENPMVLQAFLTLWTFVHKKEMNKEKVIENIKKSVETVENGMENEVLKYCISKISKEELRSEKEPNEDDRKKADEFLRKYT